MKLKIFIGSLMALLLFTALSSCRSAKPPTIQTDIKDSINVAIEHVERDTNIIAPGAKTELEFKISDLEKLPDGIILKSQDKQAGLKFIKENNKIKATCNCDTLAIQAKLRDTYTSQDRVRTITNNVITEVKYIPTWVRWLAWIGGISIGCILVVFGLRLYNLRR